MTDDVAIDDDDVVVWVRNTVIMCCRFKKRKSASWKGHGCKFRKS
jgi:hypothetical protein